MAKRLSAAQKFVVAKAEEQVKFMEAAKVAEIEIRQEKVPGVQNSMFVVYVDGEMNRAFSMLSRAEAYVRVLKHGSN